MTAPSDLTGKHNYYEDFIPGVVIRHARGKTIEAAEHVILTNLVMNSAQGHFNEEAAKATPFGRRMTFGGYTAALVIGLASQDTSENALAELIHDSDAEVLDDGVGVAAFVASVIRRPGAVHTRTGRRRQAADSRLLGRRRKGPAANLSEGNDRVASENRRREADFMKTYVVAQAIGGVIGINGPDSRTPMKVGPGVGDIVPGAMAAYGVVCALLRAQRTGRGQLVDVAMTDVILSLCERIVYQRSVNGVVARPEGNRHPMFAIFGLLPAADGWITVAAHTDEFWRIFCTLLQRGDLIDDPRSATREARVANQEFVYGEAGRMTSRFTKKELSALLGGKLPFGPANDIEDIQADEHFAIREMIVDVEHPGVGRPLQIAGVPIKMTETNGRVWSRAPKLGEHTPEVLAGLGYSHSDIASLRERRIAG
jgi:hypothetical protein